MKKLVFLFIASLAASACSRNETFLDTQEERTKSTETVLMEYGNFFTQETDGVIKLSNFTNLVGQNSPEKGASFLAYFKGENYEYDNFANKILLDSNAFTPRVEDNVFETLERKELISLYGKTVNHKIMKGSKEYSYSLYLPKPLSIKVPVTTEDNMVVDLKVGSEIVWNVDNQNDKGIVVILRYIPEASDATTAKNFPNPIEKAIGIEDSKGSYIITADDLKGLPNTEGAEIDLSVGRAGYGIYYISELNKSISIYGYTIVSSKARVY